MHVASEAWSSSIETDLGLEERHCTALHCVSWHAESNAHLVAYVLWAPLIMGLVGATPMSIWGQYHGWARPLTPIIEALSGGALTSGAGRTWTEPT